MSMHLRRLQADFASVSAAFAAHPFIGLVAHEGTPPEKYTFSFRVEGLTLDRASQPVPAHEHRAEVFLPLDYPRRPPFCRMITPVFHPNIDPQKICIGDHWSAGQSLSTLVAMIGEMICYQSYNVKSPLNAEAAAWVESNRARLPLQAADLRQGT
jgi:ubiquitin-protein ligase